MDTKKHSPQTGLSPKQVEELMKWIAKEKQEWKDAFAPYANKAHELSLFAFIRELENKLQSLLSSPQREKTEPKESELVQSLKDYFKNTAKEQIKKDWEEIEKMNFGGPTVEEYFANFGGRWPNEVGEGEITEKEIDFAQEQATSKLKEVVAEAISFGKPSSLFVVKIIKVLTTFKCKLLASHRTPSITIEERQDMVARKYGYANWEVFLTHPKYTYKQYLKMSKEVHAQHSTPVTKEGETPSNLDVTLIKAYGLYTRVWHWYKEYGFGCSECCTGDRCDEDCDAPYKGRRAQCPHCKGNGFIKDEQVEAKFYNIKLPSTPAAGQEEKK